MNKSFNSEDKIILAIDGLDLNQAKLLLEKCPNIKWVKVGLELFVREGPRVIEILKGLNKKIFLDLKFHDIPNTMRAACFEVSKLGVDIISIHASAGLKALRDSKKASVEGATSVSIKPPFVVGITVLTSFSLKDFQTDLDRNNSIEENVLRLAKLSFDSGLGMFLALSWKVGLASLGIFLIVLTKTKFVSLSSISAAILLPIFMFFYLGKFMHSYFFISLIVALLVIWKHRTNIKRLLKGEESKINQNQ